MQTLPSLPWALDELSLQDYEEALGHGIVVRVQTIPMGRAHIHLPVSLEGQAGLLAAWPEW